MVNVLKVAEKEFQDLLSNRLIIVILLMYVIIALVDLDYIHDFSVRSNQAITGLDFLNDLMIFLTGYGSLVALAIGFFTILSEKRSHTFNTLITKPVYRDTVINGKLLGATAFTVLLIAISTTLYTAGLLMFFGGQFASIISTYIVGIPLVFFVSIVYLMIFFSIATLFTIVFRNNTFALFMSILVWFFFLDIVPNVMFAGSLSLLLGGGSLNASSESFQLMNSIALLSPSSIISEFSSDPTNFTGDLSQNLSEIGKLLLYVLIPLVLSYIVFLRRDIS